MDRVRTKRASEQDEVSRIVEVLYCIRSRQPSGRVFDRLAFLTRFAENMRGSAERALPPVARPGRELPRWVRYGSAGLP
jgi:hypothetical protein